MESKMLKKKSVDQALAVLRRQCAKMERSEFDVRRSMSRWAMTTQEIQQVVDKLTAERFIDNARYAESFVRDKIQFAGWGRRRIINQLRLKQIPQSVIDSLNYMFEEECLGKLSELLEKKSRLLRAKDRYDFKNKLVRFGLYRGFELDDVLSVATAITDRKYSGNED
jgi:regulatory protein